MTCHSDLSIAERDICHEVLAELRRADAKHGPMAEPVEGLYTLRCEVMELAREVHRQNKDASATRKEAIQVAAMAIKFLRDCCRGRLCHKTQMEGLNLNMAE